MLNACLSYFLLLDVCADFNKKLEGISKDKKKHNLKRNKKGSEQDFIMTQMLEWSDMKFKITKVEIWRGGIN